MTCRRKTTSNPIKWFYVNRSITLQNNNNNNNNKKNRNNLQITNYKKFNRTLQKVVTSIVRHICEGWFDHPSYLGGTATAQISKGRQPLAFAMGGSHILEGWPLVLDVTFFSWGVATLICERWSTTVKRADYHPR